MTGGQIALTASIENYPGFPDGVNGFDLAEAMQRQAEKYGMADGLRLRQPLLERAGERYLVKTGEGDYLAKAVIAAGGAVYRKLGVPGEERLIGPRRLLLRHLRRRLLPGRGGAVVGGGDSAIDEGLLPHPLRLEGARCSPSQPAARTPRSSKSGPSPSRRWSSCGTASSTEILGEDAVTGVRLRNLVTGVESEMAVSRRLHLHRPGALHRFSAVAPSSWTRPVASSSTTGWRRNVPGVFAAGDMRANAARQAVSAAGDGATAAIRADQYISANFGD